MNRPAAEPEVRTFLHVGCGKKRKDRTITAFAGNDWLEVTLDIDERVRPDVVDTGKARSLEGGDEGFEREAAMVGHEEVPARDTAEVDGLAKTCLPFG